MNGLSSPANQQKNTSSLDVARICRVFSGCFEERYRTRLVGGADEPFYAPGNRTKDEPAIIYFRADYAASALHEVAHWCIAGSARRGQPDYGYWYAGDRNALQQQVFEEMEARPQALEWIFSQCAGVDFRVSPDNFDREALDLPRFRQAVHGRVPSLLNRLPMRAAKFCQQLIAETGHHHAFVPGCYEALPR